ncbi:metal-dependent hydrolase [Halorussus gelatinilyticus]|uniref:Metal-dependent hydrolase n=1 Tax=Halorussus gelatinilyticus TaxID=2937524 RepID=A0A8U0IMA6_9EURY|nr:metal-dependent hydrolase [Halorussus gelatinilyticus]UPW02257.1 metal-dependent hydrolase [Halorussus gelatinilyticus]
MMATTHALFGMALGALSLVVAPEYATAAIAAGGVGGLFPDLDLAGDHRKVLHFPVYYALAAVPALALAALAPSVATVAVAVFLASAALHAASDALGGGLELRPWEATSQSAVYDHYRGRWIRPRRWIRYDGAPEDLLAAAVFAVPGVLYPDRLQAVVLALLAVSTGYALVRKPLVDFGESVVDRLPAGLAARLLDD